jgi:hypothetical protein
MPEKKMVATKTSLKRQRKRLQGKIKIADLRKAIKTVMAKKKKAVAS